MKSCKNCGSPVAGYADTCGGLACRGSMEPNYLYRCDQCGNEIPAITERHQGRQWAEEYCEGCNHRTMHYLVRR